MKRAAVLGFMFSNRLAKEFWVVFETALLLVLAISTIHPFVRDRQAGNIIMGRVYHHTIHYYPSSGSAEENRSSGRIRYADDEIGAIPGLAGQGRAARGFGRIGERGAKLFFYNDDLFRYASLPLSEGAWGDAPAGADAYPVYVGGPLKERYGVGQIFTMKCIFVDSENMVEKEIRCVVAGKLAGDDFFYSLGTPGSIPHLGTIGHFHRDDTAASGGQDDGSLVLVARAWDLVPEQAVILNRLLFFGGGIDLSARAAELQAAYPDLGYFTTLKDMRANQWPYTFSANQFNVVLLFILLPLTLLGVGGYTVLMIARKQREIALYHLCGMSRRSMLCVNVASKCLLIVPSAILSLLLLPVASSFFYTYISFNWTSFFICFAFVLAVLLSSALLGAYRITHTDIIRLLHKGD